MAMIDYGALAFKNGKLISTGMFTPMKDMVGWEDTESDTYHNYRADKDEPLNLKGNYFAYIGDSEWTAAFYKNQIVVVQRFKDGTFHYIHEYFNDTRYTWSKWQAYVTLGSWIKVTKRNGYQVCKWKYKGDKYKVYFGYGVDYHSYKKWRIANYYRSPQYRLYQLKTWIENKIFDYKYLR